MAKAMLNTLRQPKVPEEYDVDVHEISLLSRHLFDTPEYHHLLDTLKRRLCRGSSPSDYLREEMFSVLMKDEFFKGHSAKFRLEWRPIADRIRYENLKSRTPSTPATGISDVITVVASCGEAEAVPVSEYIGRNWGVFGQCLVDFIQAAMDKSSRQFGRITNFPTTNITNCS